MENDKNLYARTWLPRLRFELDQGHLLLTEAPGDRWTIFNFISTKREMFSKDTYRFTNPPNLLSSTNLLSSLTTPAKVTCRKPTRHKFLALGNGKQLRPNLGGRGLWFKDGGSHKHFIHSFGFQCFQKSQNSSKITLMVIYVYLGLPVHTRWNQKLQPDSHKIAWRSDFDI